MSLLAGIHPETLQVFKNLPTRLTGAKAPIVLYNLDGIFQAAGAMNKAVVNEFPGIVPDDDGNIDVDPVANRGMKERTAINGIEIMLN